MPEQENQPDAAQATASSQLMDQPVAAAAAQPESPEPTEEWIVTLTKSGLVTKVEKLDPQTQERQELTREEYANLIAAAGLYAAYYTGIRDYATALSSGNSTTAQAYYQGMTDYFSALSQS